MVNWVFVSRGICSLCLLWNKSDISASPVLNGPSGTRRSTEGQTTKRLLKLHPKKRVLKAVIESVSSTIWGVSETAAASPLSALWLGAVGVGGMRDGALISPSCPDPVRSCFGGGICLEKVARGGSAVH